MPNDRVCKAGDIGCMISIRKHLLQEGVHTLIIDEMTQEQIDSLRMLLPEILFQNAIQFDDFMGAVTGYIKKHLGDKLTLGGICAEFHVSKNSLYQVFRESYRCTINEYILRLRMEAAKKLLRETKDPVYMISEKVGIDNYPYFCRMFKGRCGMSPTEYRKRDRAEEG